MNAVSIVFLFIGLILLLIFEHHNIIDTQKFINDAAPGLKFLMEDDYKFLLNVRYNGGITDENVSELFSKRIGTGLAVIVIMFMLFISDMDFIKVILCFMAGFAVFKMPYTNLRSY